MHPKHRSSVSRFFAGVTEFAFQCRMGIADPPLIDYISDLLVRFIQTDNIYSVRGPDGKKYDQVVDMLLEAQQRQGDAKRYLHRHIGDFTLFWTGFFPEVAQQLCSAGSKDALIDYPLQGKRAYYIASKIRVEKEVAPSPVLERLSDQFELCVYGLGEIRRQWEEEQGDAGPSLLLGD